MGKIKTFLNKKWVREIGIVPMTLYTLFVLYLTKNFVVSTVFGLPNSVNNGTDLIGLMGFFIGLSLIFWTGILAIITAYQLKGAFRFLYLPGTLAVLISSAFLPSVLFFNADYELNPTINDSKLVIGVWEDDKNILRLYSDSTYDAIIDDRYIFGGDSLDYQGEWNLIGNKLHLSSTSSLYPSPWRITTSDGYFFITYNLPYDLDGWSGNLGLMREKDWLEVTN